MQATSAHRLIALSAIAALAPSVNMQANAYSPTIDSDAVSTMSLRKHAQQTQAKFSRQELFEKRRLLRENQANAEAAQVRNMLMVLAVLRSQQSPSSLSIASVR